MILAKKEEEILMYSITPIGKYKAENLFINW